jgi:hypothetical protein
MEARNGQYKDVKDLDFAEDERARRIMAYSHVILMLVCPEYFNDVG